MTPRPLHRSLLLWSGIIVMGFMAWAWWISYRNLSIASVWRIEATHSAGGLAVLVQPTSTRFWVSNTENFIKLTYGKHGEWIYDGVVPGDSAAVFPPVRSYSGIDDVSAAIFLPHWLLLLLLVAVWLLGLVFLHRRKSRVLKLGNQGS